MKRKPLLTSRVVQGLRQIAESLTYADGNAAIEAAQRYLCDLVRHAESEEYAARRAVKNAGVAATKARAVERRGHAVGSYTS